jgi:hypothetical protein
MKKIVLSMAAVMFAGLVGACGSSMHPPTERLAATDAAIRSARELGAHDDPQAALHLTLANDQALQARKLMRDKENREADRLLQRAHSDAELSVMLVKEKKARVAAQEARKLHQPAAAEK